jgi:hypothetical protein
MRERTSEHPFTAAEWQEWLDRLSESQRDSEWALQNCINDFASYTANSATSDLRKALEALKSANNWAKMFLAGATIHESQERECQEDVQRADDAIDILTTHTPEPAAGVEYAQGEWQRAQEYAIKAEANIAELRAALGKIMMGGRWVKDGKMYMEDMRYIASKALGIEGTIADDGIFEYTAPAPSAAGEPASEDAIMAEAKCLSTSAAGGDDVTAEMERDVAERKAIDSLARYKFQMFGYWAAIWVHMNRMCAEKKPSPFAELVKCARAYPGETPKEGKG